MDKPAAPDNLIKVASLSSQTSITVSWTPVSDGVSPGGDILGYKLIVTDPMTAEQWIANGGAWGLPTSTQFTVYNLVTGNQYIFQAQAINYNGDGLLSAPVGFNACLPPSTAPAPLRSATTTSSMTITWQNPTSDGGCPLLGFAVFIDDGISGDFVEVHSSQVRNIPGLHDLVITETFGPANIGLSFRVKVLSYNMEGETFSDTASIILADVPQAPEWPVSKVTSTLSTITVSYLALTNVNGLPILSYSLEVDFN